MVVVVARRGEEESGMCVGRGGGGKEREVEIHHWTRCVLGMECALVGNVCVFDVLSRWKL